MLKLVHLLTIGLLTLVLGIAPLQAQTVEPAFTINVSNAHELVEIASLPISELARVAWSPAGDTMAVADATSIRIYDAHTLELNQESPGFGNVLDLVYSPDGRYLAFAVIGEATHSGMIGMINVDAPDGFYSFT